MRSHSGSVRHVSGTSDMCPERSVRHETGQNTRFALSRARTSDSVADTEIGGVRRVKGGTGGASPTTLAALYVPISKAVDVGAGESRNV
jgi:hypothetical protein